MSNIKESQEYRVKLSCAINNDELDIKALECFFNEYVKEEGLEKYISNVRIDLSNNMRSMFIPDTKELVIGKHKKKYDTACLYIDYFYSFLFQINHFKQVDIINKAIDNNLPKLLKEEDIAKRSSKIRLYSIVNDSINRNFKLKKECSPSLRESKYFSLVNAILLFNDYDAASCRDNQMLYRKAYMNLLLENYKKKLDGKYISPFEVFIKTRPDKDRLLKIINDDKSFDDLDRLIYGLPVDDEYIGELDRISKSKSRDLSIKKYTRYSYNGGLDDYT